MTMTREPADLHVSLESHLIETLRPLIGSVPSQLSERLSPLLPDDTSSSASQSTAPSIIPYALLQSISKWTRTEEGETILKSKSPPLDPSAYSMVALLAGTRTSPDKKFPAMPRVPTRSEGAAREISDRRAIIAVVNAVLSVICTGGAAWWAAQHAGWRDEWKVLLSLLVATIVAISEIGLYIIWETRRERRRPPAPSKGPHLSLDSSMKDKSHDIDENTSLEPAPHLGHALSQTTSSVDSHQGQALRHRASAKPQSPLG